MSAKKRIYEQFQSGAFAARTVGELCKLMDIPYRERNRLLALLDELVQDGVLFVDESGRYGTAEQLMELIDKLHNAGIGAIMDFVPVHFVKDATALGRFDGGHVY